MPGKPAGIGRPPASDDSDCAAASRALVSAWLTAAVTRSSSSSASPSARSFGSIRTESTSSRPFAFATTAPPPESPRRQLAERLGRLLDGFVDLAGVPHQVGEVAEIVEHGRPSSRVWEPTKWLFEDVDGRGDSSSYSSCNGRPRTARRPSGPSDRHPGAFAATASGAGFRVRGCIRAVPSATRSNSNDDRRRRSCRQRLLDP